MKRLVVSVLRALVGGKRDHFVSNPLQDRTSQVEPGLINLIFNFSVD